MITVKNWLKVSSDSLKKISDSPFLDAEIILAKQLKISREQLLLINDKPLSDTYLKKLDHALKQRQAGVPIAYVTKQKDFYGHNFFVNTDVLIPRPDSETLVNISKQILEKMDKPTVVELGVGSGAIIISLVKTFKGKLSAYGLDISEPALKVASKNLDQHQLSTQIKLINSDLLNNWPIKKPIDLIIANLPYLPEDYLTKNKTISTNSLHHEPKISLFSGKDGLDLYRQLNRQLDNYQVNNLLIEVLPQQIKKAITIFSNKNYSCQIKNDLGGQARFLYIYKNL